MSDDFISYYYGWMTSNLSIALIAAVLGWRLYPHWAKGVPGPQNFAQLVLIVATTVLALVGITFVTALFNASTAIGSAATGLIGAMAAASILGRG